MNFSWIKRLFKIKSTTNNSDVGISTIDTSFIKVPKLADLSKENQDKVMEYFNEIKYDNYETIVKYSDSLLEKSNKEIDFFVHDLEDSIKNISAILKEVNKDNYFKLLLYKEEIELSIEELNKIEQEAELRLIALDTYIKKEERRKYDFLGIFGKAERLRYLSDKSSLLNERQRLLIAIKLNKQHLHIIYNTLNENKELLDTMNKYLKTLDKSYELKKVCDIDIKYIDDIIDKSKLINGHALNNELLIIKELHYYQKKYWEIWSNWDYSGMENLRKDFRSSKLYCYTHNMEKAARLKADIAILLIAKERIKIKQYAYEHRNDYKNIITEINTLVSNYAKMSSTDWDIKELEKNIDEYKSLIESYRFICKNYLTDDILMSMIKSLLNLNYFLYCISGNFISRCSLVSPPWGYMGVSHNELFFEKYCDLDIEYMIVKDAEIKYYYQKALELFKQIEDKYNVKLDYSLVNQFNKDKERLENIDYIRMKGELKYLYDILNGNFDMFNIEIFLSAMADFKDDNEKREKYVNRLMAFIRRISGEIMMKDAAYDITYISIDELFYLLKYLGMKKYNLSELFGAAKPFEDKKTRIYAQEKCGHFINNINSHQLNELLVRVYLSKLEKEYDDRILIISKEIKFHPLIEYGYSKVLYSVDDELNISDRTIGIYVSNSSQAITINRALGFKQSQIKYLFMNEKIYNELRKTYNTINAKIIIVPDDIKYSELSIYLDKELEKKNNDEKALSKIR